MCPSVSPQLTPQTQAPNPTEASSSTPLQTPHLPGTCQAITLQGTIYHEYRQNKNDCKYFQNPSQSKRVWTTNLPQHCPLQSLSRKKHHFARACAAPNTICSTPQVAFLLFPTHVAPVSANQQRRPSPLRSLLHRCLRTGQFHVNVFKIFILCPVADSFWSINKVWKAFPLFVIHTQGSLGMQGLVWKVSIYTAQRSLSMAASTYKLNLC